MTVPDQTRVLVKYAIQLAYENPARHIIYLVHDETVVRFVLAVIREINNYDEHPWNLHVRTYKVLDDPSYTTPLRNTDTMIIWDHHAREVQVAELQSRILYLEGMIAGDEYLLKIASAKIDHLTLTKEVLNELQVSANDAVDVFIELLLKRQRKEQS
jgi:hypothetical protein